MISPKYPECGDRDCYTVMQACRLLDICRTSLAKYDEMGAIKSSVRGDGKKVYTGKAIKEFYTRICNF